MQFKVMSQLLTAAAVFLMMAVAQPADILAQSRGRTTAKPPTPLTLRQVIESLSTLRNSRRAEELVSKAGVQFQATPAVVDILKQFGASAKLISMIPVPAPPPSPPPAPKPPAPRIAGPLTIVCEPKDCAVVVDNRYEGLTNQSRSTITGLPPKESTVQIFADGYDHITRQVRLEEGKPIEERFVLKRNPMAREESARASLLKTLASLGGIDGLMELGDIEGEGIMHWTNSAGMIEQWMMTFSKRAGRDLAVTFKTTDGQCTVSFLGQTSKQDCRGELRNRGEKIAEQGTLLFLSYQLQDVVHALLRRPLLASETDANRVESFDAKDSYVLTTENDGLPAGLVYRVGDTDAPIQVQYSSFLNLSKGRYPGRIAVGRLNSAPVWVFTLNRVRTRVLRNQ